MPALEAGEDGEEATNDGASLEAVLCIAYGVVPVGEGNARTGRVGEGVEGIDKELAKLKIARGGGGPHLPIGLGVGMAVIERNTIGVLFATIPAILFLDD